MEDVFYKLNENAPTYMQLLKSPDWWEKLKAHMSLYIQVRKDNKVHVYLDSRRVAENAFTI